MAAQPQHLFSGDGMAVRMNATVQDLLNLPDDDNRYELIGGVIVRMPPPQEEHGIIGTKVILALAPYCLAHGLSEKIATEVGYQLWGNNTVLAPDVSIIRSPRASSETYSSVAPLLAVEIASPSQGRPFLNDKARAFIAAGTQMVWILWPDTKTVDIYTASGMVSLGMQDTIDGGTVLPGFTSPVANVFP
jgi:Uma2 family endonuclease